MDHKLVRTQLLLVFCNGFAYGSADTLLSALIQCGSSAVRSFDVDDGVTAGTNLCIIEIVVGAIPRRLKITQLGGSQTWFRMIRRVEMMLHKRMDVGISHRLKTKLSEK